MENYQSICQIGKGKFGSIFKIIRKSDSKIMVWKEIDYSQMSEKEKQQIVSEVNILRELHHPNIVRYYDRQLDKQHSKLYIIMEYCEGGDFNQLIKRCKKASEYIQEDVIWKILTQIVQAIHSCHNRIEGKVLHRDIKPSNIFLDKDNNVKLGDFGLSRVLSNESNFAYSHVGTPYYMSPEQIDEMRYNEKSDIWSLGCFVYELTTLTPPFEAKNHVSLAMKIKSGKVEKINKKYSEELWRVITWMLSVDHHLRPSIDELINLPMISIRLKEVKVKESLGKLKQIEEKLKMKEALIINRIKELESREKSIKDKEEALLEREKVLNEEYVAKVKLMESVTRDYNSKHNATNSKENINNNQINLNQLSVEDSNTINKDQGNEYYHNRDNHENNIQYSQCLFNSIQNLDYYLPNTNTSKSINTNQTSYEITPNKTKTNSSFRFDPNLYHDNELPLPKNISRYNSNQSIKTNPSKSASISNKNIQPYTQINNRGNSNGKDIKSKGIMTKRSSTAKQLPTNNQSNKQYHNINTNRQIRKYPSHNIINSNCNTNRSININTNTNSNININKTPIAKRRTNSINHIIDNSNSSSSIYIKTRPIQNIK